MTKAGGQRVQTVPDLVLDGEGAVETVVDDVQACKRELDANLMGDARVDGYLQKRTLFVGDGRTGERAEVRDGVKRRGVPNVTCQAGAGDIRHLAVGEAGHMDKIVLQGSADGDGSLDEPAMSG